MIGKLNRLRSYLRDGLTGIERAHGSLWRIESLARMHLHENLPFPDLDLDWERSPYTGLTKEAWCQIGTWILENAIQYAEQVPPRIVLPPTPAAARPSFSVDGRIRFEREVRAETEIRLMLLAACLLSVDPNREVGGTSVAAYFRALVVEGTDPDSAEYWGHGGGGGTQLLCEAAGLVVCFLLAPVPLWVDLQERHRKNVLEWMRRLVRQPVPPNNWHWFRVIVAAYLEREDVGIDEMQLKRDLLAIDGMHRGDGWYIDGDKFDFYAAWVLQLYPIFWAEIDASDPIGLREASGVSERCVS